MNADNFFCNSRVPDRISYKDEILISLLHMYTQPSRIK